MSARGGEYERGANPPLVGGGGGVRGASLRTFLKFRMQESASETIFNEKTVTILL